MQLQAVVNNNNNLSTFFQNRKLLNYILKKIVILNKKTTGFTWCDTTLKCTMKLLGLDCCSVSEDKIDAIRYISRY